jgi:protein gp37
MVSSCCPSCGNEAYIRARRRVFCASLADVFDNEVDPAWRVDLFKLIRATPNLDWVLLTKRIGNVGRMIVEAEQIARAAGDDLCAWMHRWQCGEPPENLWLGATVVNQQEANRDIPKLLAVAARVRFLSCEPLLERIDLTNIPIGGGHGHHEFDPIITANVMKRGDRNAPHVHWAIVGGESGRSAREFSVDAAREIVRQCQAAGVPVHVKQMGARPVETDVDGLPRKVVYIATAGRDAAEWPEDLRVQEFPKV